MKKSLFLVAVMAMTISLQTACTKIYPPKVGTIERDTILGVPCCVYLPEDYDERVDAIQKVFPVLYLQHGMFGSENDWPEQGHLLYYMDSLLRAQAVREMVIIMPDNFLGSVPPEERRTLMSAPNITPDGESFDITNGSAHWRKLTYEQERGYEMSGYWENHFEEFMKEVELRYSVSRDPSQRAIAGLSMGGYHTRQVSQTLPGQFGYIALFSALVTPPYSLEGNEKAFYWIGMGKEDFLYDQMQDYRHWLEENHFEYTYYESSGGHIWPNWQDYLCRYLTKLFR